MEIICIANQKGGIGKTTTATSLASILCNKGYKALLIDADPQGNSTDTYHGISKDQASLYDVLLDREDPLPIEEAIQHTIIGDIVVSDPELKKADIILANDPGALFILKESLTSLKGYDYVIIDTAPADNVILKNCLAACDRVVIPITPDRYALQGLSDLNRTINAVKKYQNPKLNIAGLLLVKYKKNQSLSKEVKDALTDIAFQMNTKVFNTTIRESVNAQKAQAMRTTLNNYAPRSTTAIDYNSFVSELFEEVM